MLSLFDINSITHPEELTNGWNFVVIATFNGKTRSGFILRKDLELLTLNIENKTYFTDRGLKPYLKETGGRYFHVILQTSTL